MYNGDSVGDCKMLILNNKALLKRMETRVKKAIQADDADLHIHLACIDFWLIKLMQQVN